MRDLVFMLLLFGLWLLFSGHFEPLLLGLGVAACLLIGYFTIRMDEIDGYVPHIRIVAIVTRFWPSLFVDICKANIMVIRRILTRGWQPDPRILLVELEQKTDIGQALVANSVTLTPGTITVEAEEDEDGNRILLVHALEPAMAKDILDGTFDKRAQPLEKHL